MALQPNKSGIVNGPENGPDAVILLARTGKVMVVTEDWRGRYIIDDTPDEPGLSFKGSPMRHIGGDAFQHDIELENGEFFKLIIPAGHVAIVTASNPEPNLP